MSLKEKILNLLKAMNNIEKSNYSNLQKLVLKLLIIVGIIFTVTTNTSAQNDNSRMLFLSGATGNLTWTLYTDGSLIINGSGTMPNYSLGDTPWSSYMSSIITVTIEDGVTSVGNNAFRGGTNITTVKMPKSVMVIRENAFGDCDKITEIIFLSTNPIDVSSNAFSNMEKSTCKLWVPDESVPLYRFSVDWRDFIVGAISNYKDIAEEQTHDSAESVASQSQNEPALLHIYRKRNRLDILPKRYDILLDNVVVGVSTNNWKTTVTVNTFGTKTISADIDGRKAEVRINFESGDVYYVRSGTNSEVRNTGRTRTVRARNGTTSQQAITETLYIPILQLMDSRLGASEFNAINSR